VNLLTTVVQLVVQQIHNESNRQSLCLCDTWLCFVQTVLYTKSAQ